MPLKQCDGGKGWQWGDHGKCYTGAGAKLKAIKQGYAEDPSHFKQEMDSAKAAKLVEDSEVEATYEDIIDNGFDEFEHMQTSYLRSYVSQKTRDSMKSSDFGDPELKKYPVTNKAHFDAAVKLLGRAPKERQAMIKRNLIRIAKKRGFALPESWQ